KFETRLEDFTNLEVYTSLDKDGDAPLETPIWWDSVDPTFDLEVRENPMEWGTAIDLTNAGPYPAGTQVNLQAVANPDTVFSRWSTDGATLSTNTNYLYTTRAQNDLVLGEFIPRKYMLTLQ